MIINGVNLFYRDIGYGQTIILLHGFRQSSSLFRSVGKRLAERYRVIMMDSRGHGHSARDARPLSISLMAKDVVAVMDELKIKKATVIGFSDGANIALQLAVDHPERLRQIVAISANARPEGLAPFIRGIIIVWKRILEALSLSTDMLNLLTNCPQISDEQLSDVRIPTLLIYGTHDIVTRRHMKLLNKLIPHSEMLMIGGAGHGSIMRMWRRYEKKVKRFIEVE